MFRLAYARSEDTNAGPVVVVLPGGPGLASVLPLRRVRARLAAAGFRVLTPEHRGVGLSRRLPSGRPLPFEAMRMAYAAADVYAMLDHAGVQRALLFGSSYGGYLALATVTARPDRWTGLILDSTSASARHDERAHQRALFWHGQRAQTAQAARLIRQLAEQGTPDADLTTVVPPVYELLGAEALVALLRRTVSGRRRLWSALARLLSAENEGRSKPFVFEGDLAMAIWFREIDPHLPDGLPFDRTGLFGASRQRYEHLGQEPFDFADRLPELQLPTVVLAGDRDTRIPPDATRELVDGLPHISLVRFPQAGHDLLRLRTSAVTQIAAALARGGLPEVERVAERVRHTRPRGERLTVRMVVAALDPPLHHHRRQQPTSRVPQDPCPR